MTLSSKSVLGDSTTPGDPMSLFKVPIGGFDNSIAMSSALDFILGVAGPVNMPSVSGVERLELE